METTVTVTLSVSDYHDLLLALGYAAGAACRAGDSDLSKGFLRLGNKLRDNATEKEDDKG